MRGKLYRRVYFSAFIVIVVTLFATAVGTSLLFDRGVQSVQEKQALLLQGEIRRAYRENAAQFPEAFGRFEKNWNCRIDYWQAGQWRYGRKKMPPKMGQNLFRNLSHHPEKMVWRRRGRLKRVGFLLEPSRPAAGFVWVHFSRFRPGSNALVVTLLLLFVILGLLLVPYTRFILRPYRALQESIERLSDGDFSQPISEQRFPVFLPLVSAFNQMSERLQAMLQSRQRLLADVSHELRSPLTRLRLVLEVLRRESKQLHLVDQGIEEIESLDLLIQELLNFSRLELDPDSLVREEGELNSLIQGVLSKNAGRLDAANIVVSLECPVVNIQVDTDKLKRAFENIIGNWIKYAAGSPASIRVIKEGEDVCLYFEDTGPSVSESHLEHLFTPFYRPDTGRSPTEGGVGLGLAIVDQTLRAHGGRVYAYHTSQQGLGIALILPLVSST